MNPGRLRHHIDVLKSDPTARDDYGALDPNARLPVFEMRCNVQVLSGSELLKAGMELTSEFISVLARYDKRLNDDHFLNWEGKEYTVQSIKPSDDKRRMTITASRET